ncbi:MAG: hypothetical protein H6741_02590 [Alphaproteobacteria bacterium]|nr:hypothetical protein [Alphaproteobacteria bacterium]MCB9791592.1 hypothetical protein [Alphaproteobacteria bacterium]
MARRPELAGALAALPLTLWAVGPTVGRWKTPGVPDAALFETLLGVQAPLASASPLSALLQGALGGLLDPPFALGVVTFLGFWLAGLGGWIAGLKLGRSSAEEPIPWASAAVGLAALQLSPALLRGACTAEPAVFGVGLAALALGWGGPRGALASAIAAAWSWPAGLMALLAAPRERLRWALTLPLLLLQLAAPLTAAPEAAPEPVVMAYVSEAGAALPLRAEVAPEAPEAGLRQSFRGLHGGLAAWIGGLAALAFGPRLLGLAGLGLSALVWFGVGPMPAPGAPPPPLELAPTLLSLPGFGDAGLAWAAAGALAGAAGLSRLTARLKPGVYLAVVLVFFSALVENPRVSLPVSNLPPDPALETLRGLDPGQVVVFPSPLAPWGQAGRSEAEQRWRLRGLEARLAEPSLAAGLVGPLAAISGLSVSMDAAPLLWETRGRELESLREAGLHYLLIDQRTLPEAGRGPMEAWLAERVGAPLAEGEEYALYTMSKDD